MPFVSAPELLVLHHFRLRGIGQAGDVATRFGLAVPLVDELLLDDEARGYLTRVAHPGVRGWSMTDAGRAEDDRRLAAELERSGARPVVEAADRSFRPLNTKFLNAVTRWQIRPTPHDALAANDHSSWPWDELVLDDLATLGGRLKGVLAKLTAALPRFAGYDERYADAFRSVEAGQRRWVDEPGIDSCHAVWAEFHQDLLTTLGGAHGR
jgi:hypothetical protein